MTISAGKRKRLDAISTARGVIAAVAMDQRSSLRKMIAASAGVAPEEISDSQLAGFKAEVAAALTPYASSILLDPEYGLDAAARRAPHCGLLMTYEVDGFENPRPHRMLALMAGLSVRRLRDLGADAIKILLSWAPDDDGRPNEEKRAMIERIGCECGELDMPFLLEPVVYDAEGRDLKSFEFAPRKPELVLRTMKEFSNPEYRVDVLKVEFPLGVEFVEGNEVFSGSRAFSWREALRWFREVDGAAQVPYIYLSAGVGIREFTASLELAAEAGARFSGILCGRAIWQDGAHAFTQGGPGAFRAWLLEHGVRNVSAIDSCLKAATPWHERVMAAEGRNA